MSTECRSCGAIIMWMRTKSGKRMPVNYGSIPLNDPGVFDPERGHISHFATCPNADKHRKPRK